MFASFVGCSVHGLFVFIITSYNNAAYYKKNIDSVLTQAYSGPFRVIYVDDHSEDKTGDLVESYVKSLSRDFSGTAFQGLFPFGFLLRHV